MQMPWHHHIEIEGDSCYGSMSRVYFYKHAHVIIVHIVLTDKGTMYYAECSCGVSSGLMKRDPFGSTDIKDAHM